MKHKRPKQPRAVVDYKLVDFQIAAGATAFGVIAGFAVAVIVSLVNNVANLGIDGQWTNLAFLGFLAGPALAFFDRRHAKTLVRVTGRGLALLKRVDAVTDTARALAGGSVLLDAVDATRPPLLTALAELRRIEDSAPDRAPAHFRASLAARYARAEELVTELEELSVLVLDPSVSSSTDELLDAIDAVRTAKEGAQAVKDIHTAAGAVDVAPAAAPRVKKSLFS